MIATSVMSDILDQILNDDSPEFLGEFPENCLDDFEAPDGDGEES